jgi:predicted nucleic acid-binding protein
MIAVFDNDVVTKGVSYGIINDFCSAADPSGGPVGVLGTARFVVESSVRRCEHATGTATLLDSLRNFLATAEALDPSEDERELAADLELAALRRGVALDTGESQLCAIVIERGLRWLVTGDKRAIAAIEQLLEDQPRLADLSQRVMCIEQIMLILHDEGDAVALRAAICAEPAVDKALTSCFSCRSSDVPLGSIREGLSSYVEAVRAVAPRVMVG